MQRIYYPIWMVVLWAGSVVLTGCQKATPPRNDAPIVTEEGKKSRSIEAGIADPGPLKK